MKDPSHIHSRKLPVKKGPVQGRSAAVLHPRAPKAEMNAELAPETKERFLRTLGEAGVSDDAAARCLAHFELVRRWNQTHNLTRIVNAEDAAVRHYLDCAIPVLRNLCSSSSVEGNLHPREFVDVGSGAGFPGLVVASLLPHWSATLVEPARKRASFLTIAAASLRLSGVRVVSALQGTMAPWVLSRATFSARSREELWPYVVPGGLLWAWTTPSEEKSWNDLVATWPDATLTWDTYRLHGVGDRTVVVIRRQAA